MRPLATSACRTLIPPLAAALVILLLPADSLAARDTYRGKTSQGRTIRIVADDSAIHRLVIWVSSSCGPHSIHVADRRIPFRNGRFRLRVALPGGAFSFAGRRRGRRLTGVVRERYSAEQRTCDTGRVRFSARRR